MTHGVSELIERQKNASYLLESFSGAEDDTGGDIMISGH